MTTQDIDIPEWWIATTLGKVIIKVQDKINVSELNKWNYISTENMLPNMCWITEAATLPTISSVSKFQIGDILFSNIRTYFKKLWFAGKVGGASNDVIIFRWDDNQIKKEFLFYLLSDNKFFDYTVKTSKWTKMPRWDKDAIRKYPILLPTIPEQKEIASILSSFDDKIQLLRKQNETLEKTAQTIFQEWFGKYSIDDELPEGWRIGKLGEVVEIKWWTTPSTQNPDFWDWNISWTSPRDLSNSKELFLFQTESKITDEWLKQVSSGLLNKWTLLLSSRAPIWYLAIADIEVAINQGYIAFIEWNYFSNKFMYLWLKLNMQIVLSSANGSTFLEISKSSFRNIECVIPGKNILNEFDISIKPMFDKIRSNLIQIGSLSKSRDELLPKLMGWVIRV